MVRIFEVKILASETFLFLNNKKYLRLFKHKKQHVYLTFNLYEKECCLVSFPFKFFYVIPSRPSSQKGFWKHLFFFIIFICVFHYVNIFLAFCVHYLIEKTVTLDDQMFRQLFHNLNGRLLVKLQICV